MSVFGKNLTAIRQARNLKGKELAARIGATPSMVSRWERQDVDPESETAAKLAHALDVSIDELLGGPGRDQIWQGGTGQPPRDEFEEFDRDITRGYKKGDVPVVGDAEASTNGVIAWNDEGLVRGQIEEWVARAFSNGDPRSYALRVRGDSMEPRYSPGELVVAQPNAQLRDGDYAVVMLRSDERLVKRVFRTSGGWILRSLNPLYPDRTVTDDDVVMVHAIRHHIARP